MNKQIKPIRSLPMESCAFHFSISPGGRSFALSNLLFKAFAMGVSNWQLLHAVLVSAPAPSTSSVDSKLLRPAS